MGSVSRSSVVSAMLRATVLCLGVAITLVYAQDYEDVVLPVSGSPAPEFKCPKQDGKFRDNEYCDLYYVCKNGEAKYKWCPDGKGWDDSSNHPTRHRCNFLVSVECDTRSNLQLVDISVDERCARANGANDHNDPNVCDKYIQCEEGFAYELPCAQTLVFDKGVGTCVRLNERTDEAKSCETEQEVDPLEVDGFTCPATSNSGPAGSANPQHTIYPHPYKCPFYFSCYNNKYPNLFGCPEAEKQVFHPDKKRCVSVEDGPDYCKCYYDDTGCPSCPSGQSCLEDCTCGDPDALYEDEYPTNN